jgi:hypothetical protein
MMVNKLQFKIPRLDMEELKLQGFRVHKRLHPSMSGLPVADVKESNCSIFVSHLPNGG